MKDRSLSEVSEYAISERELLTVQQFIRNKYIYFGPNEFHKIIPQFSWRAIFTTNFDMIIEAAYKATLTPAQTLVPFVKNDQQIDQELRRIANSVPYIKLHGCCDHYLDRDIPFILATEQYAKYAANRTILFSFLQDLAREYSLVFCGYNVLDPYIVQIMHNLFDLGSIRPAYFIVKRSFDEIEERYWSGKRVAPISLSFETFLRALVNQLNPALARAATALIGTRHPVAHFYIKNNVVESDDLNEFLAHDVSFLATGMPIETISAKDFYEGYDPDFSGVSAGFDVRRRLTDTVIASTVLDERPPTFVTVRDSWPSGLR